MKFEAYKQTIANLSIGKRLPDAVYLHSDYLEDVPENLANFIESVVSKHGDGFEWNVIKLYRRDHKISLLSYPTFYEDSYPPLVGSMTIDLVRSKTRTSSYTESKNPPILHRKETLIPPTHPKYEKFTEITREGEEAGLYEQPRTIGFKNSWEQLISNKGYRLVDGHLRPKAEVQLEPSAHKGDIDIQRHLTAVNRDQLSVPMQSLGKHGYLDGEHSILDYGCGKGHDLLELEAHGLDAVGWDPAYRPDDEKRPSDIVNLGFVINVIEDIDERVEALRTAQSLSKTIMVVSAMIGGEATIGKFRPYKDGVVTSRGTFQKYYSQSELRSYIESSLKTKAIAVAPGVFYVFKNEIEEQRFLAQRQRVHREWRHLTRREKISPEIDHQAAIENNLGLFKDFWETCLDFGRPPANDEFERSEEIRRIIGSHRKALIASKEYFGDADYERSKIGRKKDLTVFLSLSYFDRHRAYIRMPISLQRDIRAFFEKPSLANDFAKEALYAIADTELIETACKNAFKKLGCGRLDNGHSYTILASLLDQLPPILRIYVGCAAQLYGDLDVVDLIKIHVTSGKVSLMIYDDFDKPLPILKERIKIRMRDQYVDFFQNTSEREQQPIYRKSMYMQSNDPQFKKQKQFDRQLMDTGLDFSGYGPNLAELNAHLAKIGFELPQNLQ